MAEPQRQDRGTEPTARAARSPSADGGGSRGLAVAAHLLGIVTSVIGPLVILLTAGRDAPYVRDQAREALNFQFTVLLALVVAFIAFVVIIGPVLVVVVAVVLGIVGAVKSGQGAAWRYPVSARLAR